MYQPDETVLQPTHKQSHHLEGTAQQMYCHIHSHVTGDATSLLAGVLFGQMALLSKCPCEGTISPNFMISN